MLKSLKSATKQTRTRVLASALAVLAALAVALSVYAATDNGSPRRTKHAALAKGGVKGFHEGRAPAAKRGSSGRESAGGTDARGARAAIDTTHAPAPTTGTTGSGRAGGQDGGATPESSPKAPKSVPSAKGGPKRKEAASFSISGSPHGALSPGGAPSSIALRLSNPNGVTIHVTSLQASVSGGGPGCAPAQNIVVMQAAVSSAHALSIPANASVTLPTQGIAAPTIQLLDLPVDQDACADAQFTLRYSGRAEG